MGFEYRAELVSRKPYLRRIKDLRSGHYIASDAEWGPSSGNVACNVHLTNTNKILGFTAAAKVLFYGYDGKLLGSDQRAFGINQTALIGAVHRNETWSTQAPAGTAGFALSQFWDPRYRVDLEPLGQAIENFLR